MDSAQHPSSQPLQSIDWASHPRATPVQNMCVDHGRPHIAMAEEFLNRSDVVPVLEQVGGKGVPECVAGSRLGQARLAEGFLDRPLQDRFVEVVPTALAGIGNHRAVRAVPGWRRSHE